MQTLKRSFGFSVRLVSVGEVKDKHVAFHSYIIETCLNSFPPRTKGELDISYLGRFGLEAFVSILKIYRYLKFVSTEPPTTVLVFVIVMIKRTLILRTCISQ